MKPWIKNSDWAKGKDTWDKAIQEPKPLPLGKRDRIQELEKLIIKAGRDYYNKTPTVSDEVFDAWVDELKSLSPIFRMMREIKGK